jgi:hypothetical protein
MFRRAQKSKAVLLISRHGSASIDHPRLRAFADRNAVALVSVKGDPMQRGFTPVGLLDEYVARLGRMLSRPELAALPLITLGQSNGTGFAAISPSERPDRVIAWISFHAGTAFHLQFPGVEKVPGLVMHGLIDPFFIYGQKETVLDLWAERDGACAAARTQRPDHFGDRAQRGPFPVDRGQNATWDFIAAYCEAAMRVRLKDDGGLKPVALEDGWLGAAYDVAKGGQQSLAIAPYRAFQGDRSTATWLPDEGFAEVWRLYEETDPRTK